MIRDLCPEVWAPIEDAMLRVLRHPGTGPGPEREGPIVPIGLGVLTATEDRDAGLGRVTVPVPYGAYFDFIVALEARLADGAVRRWCEQDPYGQTGRHDIVRYAARLREHAFALGY
jgi:hypothetical protein